jgi:hypothetical protein
MSALKTKLASLQVMTPSQLRAEWREQLRTVTPDIGPDLLRRGIAYRIQERRFGKLSSSTRRELDRIAAKLIDGSKFVSGPAKLKVGTRLIRSWHGKVHQVLVLENGYEHEGRRYRSLSQIARAITGAHWSGPRFFGLRKANANG